MMLESIDIIRRIWSGQPPYEINGEFWRFAIKKASTKSSGIGFMPSRCSPAVTDLRRSCKC